MEILEVSTERLVTEIDSRYPLRWGHWTDWVGAALEALVTAGLARRLAANQYVVGYRDLTRELGEPTHAGAETETTQHPREYPRILATYICAGAGGEQPQAADTTDKNPQRGLF